MANDLLFGIQTNGIRHAHADPMPDIDTRFAILREAGSLFGSNGAMINNLKSDNLYRR